MFKTATCLAVLALFASVTAFGQMGRTWPSEKKIVPDPVTGLPLEFLTSTDGGYTQEKIYQTHRQWTADGKWLIFRGREDFRPPFLQLVISCMYLAAQREALHILTMRGCIMRTPIPGNS